MNNITPSSIKSSNLYIINAFALVVVVIILEVAIAGPLRDVSRGILVRALLFI
ncbi:MAG: hypothetical protein ACR5KW_01050 [Wolbachia sp.]